jgi:Tfp pilus assembly protein PilF
VTHRNLGNARADQGRPREAEAEYREALRLKPDYPIAHNDLGTVLAEQGRPREAEAEFREAVRLKPDYPRAHYNLGNALRDQGRPKEAEAAFREAIRLQPDYPEAHCNPGHTLRQQGRFAEALVCLKRGHELGLKQPGWRYPSAQWVQQAERLAALESKLAAFLKGTYRPTDNQERLGLVEISVPKQRYRAAAQLYADAFAADPKAADDLRAGHRYNAARSAALAAAGRGTDAPQPNIEERARLRGQALGWLQADLILCQKQVDSGKAEGRAATQRTLQHWQSDPDLAGVRDQAGLAKQPDTGRAAWEKLWADVEALRKRAREAK